MSDNASRTASSSSAKVDFQRALYDSNNPTRRYLHRVRRELIRRLLQANCSRDARLLEVGVGADVYGDVLRAAGRIPVRIDIEAEYLLNARSASQQQSIVQADVLNLPFASGVFDGVLCSEVLEHLPPSRSEDALRELARVLSPRGRLVFSTPQKYSLAELAGKLMRYGIFRSLAGAVYREPFDVAGSIASHTNLVTRSVLLSQAARVGLASLHCETCGLYIPGIAELGGQAGATLTSLADRALRATPLSRILWTQVHVFELRSS
jgi:ubiquinone/menaquinone biosynthesis C-methylase UbiE